MRLSEERMRPLQHVDQFVLSIEQVAGDEGQGIGLGSVIEAKNDRIGGLVKGITLR